jgi:hypothetical protein
MDDDDWVLRMAHQACHGANHLSNRIEAQLHVRFREQIRFVRNASYLDLVRQLAGEGFTKYELVGLRWALHTDSSIDKRLFGENLLKAMVTDTEAAPPDNILPGLESSARCRHAATPTAGTRSGVSPGCVAIRTLKERMICRVKIWQSFRSAVNNLPLLRSQTGLLAVF